MCRLHMNALAPINIPTTYDCCIFPQCLERMERTGLCAGLMVRPTLVSVSCCKTPAMRVWLMLESVIGRSVRGERWVLAPSHKHTVTPSHKHTATQSHPHTVTQSHPHTVTQSRPHTVTPSHPHTLTHTTSCRCAALME